MTKGRMEAFSDGVFAVIITIMVLEMKSPHGTDLAALQSLLPVFFSYVLSFVYVGIYWNNHHHLLQAAKHVTGGILWANLHVLFWLSPTPFVTAWMGENHFAPWPVARTTRFYQTTAALQPRILCFGFFSALASFLLWLLSGLGCRGRRLSRPRGSPSLVTSCLATIRPEASDPLHTDEWRIRVATCRVCPLHIQVRALIWREIYF